LRYNPSAPTSQNEEFNGASKTGDV